MPFVTFHSIGDAPAIQWTQVPGQPRGFISSPSGLDAPNVALHFLPGPFLADAPEADQIGALSAFGDIPAILAR